MTGEPSTDLVTYPFSHTIRVRFAETDAMRIVHHGRYFPYLEEARVEYLRAIDHPYTAWQEAGIESAVLEAFVRYRSPLRFDELVVVHVALRAVRGATFQMDYALSVDGELRSTAVTVHALLGADGRPQRLPAWLVDLNLGG